MRSIRAILMVAALAACDPMPAPSPGPSAAGVDSISLWQSPCYGTCPAYRVSISRMGDVRFQSLGAGDSTVATDRVAPAAFEELAREAERIGFRSFPDRVDTDPELCGPLATDHSTVTVAVHGPAGSKSVGDDRGCHGRSERLAALRRFAHRIDSVAGSARWTRPATRR